MSKIYLQDEFDKFWRKLENKENFAFMRNADGERAIMMGVAVAAQEDWQSPNYISKLGKDLYNSLLLVDDNIYYGISCPCCDNEAYYWYSSRIPSTNRTFANLWINSNYQKFSKLFLNITRDVVLIANYRARNKKIANLNIIKHYEIDDDCIAFWENEAPKMIENIKKDFGDKNNILYVVSAGPMSGPIIAELFKNNPNNCYVDFGSSIDVYYRGAITRPYMVKGNVYAERNCWLDNPYTTNFDVSIVLNLYKRPENLELQLKAIEEQSLKPKEIILYQDPTSDNTTVEIPEHLQDHFAKIEVGPENKGVWERFRVADKLATSQFVCVFDDDTIPGKRWLENCHTEMLKQEGLYGTIGIVLEDPKNYPLSSFYRVGWAGNLDYTVEVDFVGHSWFFKKEWLPKLFSAPRELQQLKLAGEDMAFSYELLKDGIKTFVPPHPSSNVDFFGSNPDLAMPLGRNDVAISMDQNNLFRMKEAISVLLDCKWPTLSFREPNHIKKIKSALTHKKGNSIFGYQKTKKHRIYTIFGIKLKIRRK